MKIVIWFQITPSCNHARVAQSAERGTFTITLQSQGRGFETLLGRPMVLLVLDENHVSFLFIEGMPGVQEGMPGVQEGRFAEFLERQDVYTIHIRKR